MLRLARLVAALLALTTACASPPPRSPARVESQADPHALFAASPKHAALRAGTSGDYPPLSQWTGARPEGFAPALLEAFARSAKIDVTWTRFRWPELAGDLRAKKFDLAADGITVRPERSIAGRFSVPIARGGAVLLLRRPAWAARDADAKALDRADLRIAVNKGGHLERVTRSLFKTATIVAIPDNTKVRDALARGEVDALMTNTFEAPRWASGIDGVERLGPLTHDVTAFWMSSDRSDVADRLDAWLLEEEASGRLGALRTQWLGGGEAAATPVGAILAATVERLALMPFVAAAKKRTGAAIEDTAQEERVLAASVAAVEKAAAAQHVPPPPAAITRAFFTAQIEAAKEVQAKGADSEPSYALGEDLRPAIARISARMAALVVRIPHGTKSEDVLTAARADLGDSGIADATITRVATTLAAFGE